MDLPTKTTLDLWWHYEEIAMHFNQLLMQFRLQVIGGAGALGTLAGYVISEKVGEQRQPEFRALAASGLGLLIATAAVLDLAYYTRLLEGAVKALTDFEEAHREIRMSLQIEDTVCHGLFGEHAAYWAYGVMLTTVFLFAAWSWWQFLLQRHAVQSPPAPPRDGHIGMPS
jgi:hypothetical protein